jgi:hypothetical protein
MAWAVVAAMAVDADHHFVTAAVTGLSRRLSIFETLASDSGVRSGWC